MKHTFTYVDKPRQIHKPKGRDAAHDPWFYRLHTGTQDLNRSLQTNDIEKAVKRAKTLIDASRLGADKFQSFLEATAARRTTVFSTVGELLAKYETIAGEASPSTRHLNANQLLNFLRQTEPANSDPKPETLRSDKLTDALVYVYRDAVATAAEAEPDQERSNRRKRSANALLGHIRSIFTGSSVRRLKGAGVELPDLAKFLKACKEARFKIAGITYHPPSEQIIKATLVAWPTLPRNEYLAVGLELSCGLRCREIAQARWSWFTVRNGLPFLDGAANVKNKSARIQVSPLDPWWTDMQTRIEAEHWADSPDATIITGTATECKIDTYNRVSAWLRSLGWATQKTNHALRAYSGSMIAMKWDIYTASRWLRHSSIKVTQDHYSHFVNAQQAIDRSALAIDWAKTPTTPFTPRVLPAATTA